MGNQVFSSVPTVGIETSLFVLDQDGNMTLPSGSPWEKDERHAVLSVMAAAATRTGRWHPIDMEEFVEILNESPYGDLPKEKIDNTLQEMDAEGFLLLTEDVIVPDPSLETVLHIIMGDCPLTTVPAWAH